MIPNYNIAELTMAMSKFAQSTLDAVKAIANFSFAIFSKYPNKRVLYLALYHPKKRIRKKNLNRIKKWVFSELN